MILASEQSSQPLFLRIIKSLFYPVYIIVAPESWSFFRTITASLSMLFLVAVGVYKLIYKKIGLILFIAIILFLANTRPTEANRTFYETFHIAPWYALLIFSLIYLIKIIYLKSKKTVFILLSVLLLLILYIVANRSYFPYEHIDTNVEFFTNYATVMGTGTIIRELSG
ncbi:MAG: hypothetical protein ABI091_16550, partial [Ferruginibacter sp.]